MSKKSGISFVVVVEDITEEVRTQILSITQSIEEGLQQLNQENYQEILNFVMSMNSQFGKFILLKVHGNAPIPHISTLRDKLRHRAESIDIRLSE